MFDKIVAKVFYEYFDIEDDEYIGFFEFKDLAQVQYQETTFILLNNESLMDISQIENALNILCGSHSQLDPQSL